MAAQPLYRSDPSGDARNSQDHISANVPVIDRRPWVVRVRAACRGSGLPLATRAVGLAIGSYFDATGEWSVPEKTLCAELDIHRSTLHRHLTALKEAGILSVDINRTRCNRYSTGARISKMKPAPRAVDGAMIRKDATAANVADMRPVRTRSGYKRTERMHRSNSTRPQRRKRKRDPRDDDRFTCPKCKHEWPARFGTLCLQCGHDTKQIPTRAEPEGRTLNQKGGSDITARYTCSACARTWARKHGERCHGCGSTAREAINAGLAAAERYDRTQAERLQAEKDRQPVTCWRCAYDKAKRADLTDIGRCSHCISLTDAEAAALAKRGKALRKRMVQAWKDRDHVRGKAIAEQATALYACCTG